MSKFEWSSETPITYDNLNKIVLDAIYPVGSIYMNINDINPAIIFGGEWERIQARFLIGTGTLNTQNSTNFYGDTPNPFTIWANETGGENLTTLTVNQMPSHDHSTSNFFGGYPRMDVREQANQFSGLLKSLNPETRETLTNAVDYAGGNQAHNNMPPYLAVYIWKRIS